MSHPQHPAREPQPGAGLPPAQSDFLAAPEGYFNRFDAAVQARIQGEVAPGSLLHNPVLRQAWLTAPDGYFASFPSRIVTRVQALRRSFLPDLSALLAPQTMRFGLPVLLVGVMIAGGWLAARRDAATPTTLSIRAAAREEVLTAINHELDGFDDALLAEHLLPQQPAASGNDAVPVDTALEDYLARNAETSEIMADAAIVMTP